MGLRNALLFSLLLSCGCPAEDFAWRTATPQKAGIDARKLDAATAEIARRATSALLVVRHGEIVAEWYAPGNGPTTLQGTASLAKALIGGMSLLLAIDEKLISPDDLASKYILEWKNDPRKSRITIRHLATHTSGIEDAEQDDTAHDKLPGWKGAFWRRDPDPFSIAIRQAPVLFEPGTQQAYSNPGMAALAYAVTASLKGTQHPDIKSLLEQRVMQPLGIAPSEWSVGYGRAYEVDGLSLYANWGGAAFTPRAAAKIGLLLMARGEWNHRQIIQRESVEKSLAYAGVPVATGPLPEGTRAAGLGFWVNTHENWPGLPKDAFGGSGAGHKTMVVAPSLDLVIFRGGQDLDETDSWPSLVKYVLRPLVGTIVDKAPYPPSPVIGAVRFAPQSAIKQAAIDSDNWPITWAGDGHQYTAYGDGFGFDPQTDKKLSQGFARVEGSPTDFRGINIRSETGERLGNGAKGLKASGMIMVNGVLFLWVRNAQNSQLARSRDLGKTWEWGFRMQSGFGSPSFLNFGKNYAGARDAYVYTYSQDGGNAYQSDDNLALARVRQDRLWDRAEWEFLERIDEHGAPQWTKDVEQRGSVFRYPGHCQRVDAVYNPGLKRYLLAVGYNHDGGWGIYDAPEPWGPWTTAFHDENWGLPTHGYRLPAKWISENGRTMSLIFSGIKPWDAFCVREMTLLGRNAAASR
jgi:CubicO group peptidase (beta-lactamase class C family)